MRTSNFIAHKFELTNKNYSMHTQPHEMPVCSTLSPAVWFMTVMFAADFCLELINYGDSLTHLVGRSVHVQLFNQWWQPGLVCWEKIKFICDTLWTRNHQIQIREQNKKTEPVCRLQMQRDVLLTIITMCYPFINCQVQRILDFIKEETESESLKSTAQ